MSPADQEEDCDGIEAVSSFSDTKFLLQQKVLCVDTNSFSSNDANAPLYEAVIRKSELKFIDPTTGNIIPDKKRGRGRGRQIVGTSSSPTSGSSGAVLLQQWCHFIHFNGWNSRWDRWVKEQDLFHDTAANRKRVSDNIVGKVARLTSKQPKEDDKRDNKKRKRATTEPDRNNLQMITRASELPFTLQTVLVDDRDKITTKVYPPPILFSSKQQQQQQQRRKDKAITMLHVIPSPTSIVDLMGQYLQTKKQEDLENFAKYHRGQRDESGNSSCSSFDVGDGSSMDIAICITKSDLKANKKKRKEFALSILALFDASLPLFLLYAEERSQFTKLMSKEVIVKKDEAGDDKSSNGQQPSHFYPAEYLLRLFVKIPNLLAEFDSKRKLLLSSNEKSQDFAKFLSELIVYMQKRVEEVFPGNYQAIEVQD